jgi:tetratricopeptide (TPR) repeat protein
MASPASELNEKIDYQLPYPGLLPDSPLYFLRIIRDKSVGLLISDPLKKAEFDLLQADKRLNAGIYLFNKGKTSLALSTISKAENYFNEALNKMEQAKAQGERVNEIKGNLQNALEKHEQELEYLTAKVGRDFKVSFEKERKRLTDFEERLSR